MKRRNPEEQLQRTVAQFLDWSLISPSFYTAFPAGGGGRIRGARLKKMGLKAGFPDLLIVAPGLPLLTIELKSKKGGLSPEQKETTGYLMLAGVRCYVARSVEEVAGILRLNGLPLRTRLT